MNRVPRIYVAGPMTGLPEHNFPAFHATASLLRAAGCEVVNPASNFGGRTDLPRPIYLRVDVALLLGCDAVVMLPGWRNSRGAKLEYLLARELGMPVIDSQTWQALPPWQPMPEVRLHPAAAELSPTDGADDSILLEAERLTSGDRQDDYGHPRDDFEKAAHMWTAILTNKLRPDEKIDAREVPLCMIAVKLARQSHRHKRDNLVDIAGYAQTAAMVNA